MSIDTHQLSGDEKFIHSPNAAFRQIGEEIVIVDTMHNCMMSLNRTGTEIWTQLVGRTINDITSHIASVFEVDSLTARQDTTHFLSELYSRGLILSDNDYR